MISEFEKEKVFWTKKMNLKLVKFIESRPNIWNPKHPKYTSIEARDKTYNEFALKYGNEFTGQAVRDRWTNIRSTFANYLRKLTASRAKTDGEEYKVNWHLWEPCRFLLKVSRKIKVESTLPEDVFGGDVQVMNELLVGKNQVQHWSTEEGHFSDQNDVNDSTCKTIADNIVEIFKDTQNDVFGVDSTSNGKVGKAVADTLSALNSFDATTASKRIMDILLLYDKNNPNNPNNMKSTCL